MIDKESVLQELAFKAVRSSGAGGQHVNKVSSKVELSFNMRESGALTEEQKERLLDKLRNRISKEGIFVLQCGESRSQHKNKALVTERFFNLIMQALTKSKKRIPTKIPRSVIKKRLKSKRHLSDKKANRRKPNVD
ncbi:MAG: alternative ribosome rescue aminoacyl-tRNA hydrolase ArfB [Aestuariibaculum sp.]